jgi:hypothetical protein
MNEGSGAAGKLRYVPVLPPCCRFPEPTTVPPHRLLSSPPPPPCPPRPRLVGALKALEKSEKAAEDDGKPPRREAAEQRVALLEQLGWGHWAAYERARLPGRFPAGFPPI